MKMKQKNALLKQLETIEDFREHEGKIVYPLSEIIFITLFGILKGYTTFKDLHSWMEFNKNNPTLKKILKKKTIEIPCRSTFHRILVNIPNNALEGVFREFFKKHIKNKNIAIDGKWLNGSDVSGQYTQEGHKSILNIFDKDAKITFAHVLLGKTKKSEIPAFKELLEDKLFSSDGQIFTFDALHTQSEILNTINEQKNKYIAKVKGNQKLLKEKVIFTASNFVKPIDTYEDTDAHLVEGNKAVKRKVEIFQNRECDLVMHSSEFKNIQTIIKVTKTTTNNKTGEVKTRVEYLIANFKTSAQEFKEKILQHWRVETYHYHLDELTGEDDHIAYIDPYSISILRSFAVNLYQLFLNSNIDKKPFGTAKVTMAETKRYCMHDDIFASDIFEIS